jgi:small ligand-binding sensory domain FIST
VIAAGSGLAFGASADDLALKAALQALGRSEGDHADLALVFVTPQAYPRAHELLHAVRRVTGARAVVGCSGAGVLTERMEVETAFPSRWGSSRPGPGGSVETTSAVAVLVIRSERLVATPFLLEDQEGLGARLPEEVAEKVGPAVAEGGSLLVLPDPLGLAPRPLLDGLHEALGFLPVLGGVAAGPPFFEILNLDLTQGGIAGVALSGAEALIGVAQGCQPIGEPYVITRARDNVIQEIGSRPALLVLREALLSLDDPEERIGRAGIFVGLAMDPAKSPLERGDFLVRNLIGVDRQSGAVAVAERVRVGQTVQFQIRDAASAREDLDGTLQALERKLAGRKPAFGCYFNCAGRGEGLFGVPDHDVTLITKRLGEFPLIGFFGNGEFAPIGRRNFFHNYTGALVVFPHR